MTHRSKFPLATRKGLDLSVEALNREFPGIATFTLEEGVFDGEPSFVVAAVLHGDADSGAVWWALHVLKTLYQNVGYSVCRGDRAGGE